MRALGRGGTSSWLAAALCVAGASLLAGCAASASRPLQFVSGAELDYPPAAKAAGLEGYVVVRYDVNAAGAVVNARVVEAAPPMIFDDSALRSVRQWRFKARMVNGEAVSAGDRVSTVRFRLGAANEYPIH